MDRITFIDYNNIKEEYRDNYYVKRIIDYYNVLEDIDLDCEDCCGHDRDDCENCSLPALKNALKTRFIKLGEYCENDLQSLKGKLLAEWSTKDNPYLSMDDIQKIFVKPKEKIEYFNVDDAKHKLNDYIQYKLNNDLNFVYRKINEGIEKRCHIIYIDFDKREITNELITFLKDKGFDVSKNNGNQKDPCNQLIVKIK